MSQIEGVHAIFYMHQTSGTCASVCVSYRMYQMEKNEVFTLFFDAVDIAVVGHSILPVFINFSLLLCFKVIKVFLPFYGDITIFMEQ